MLFFFNDPATTEIYTLSLHDALPICQADPRTWFSGDFEWKGSLQLPAALPPGKYDLFLDFPDRSEEHTSELQSHSDLVCRLLLEKKTTIPLPGSAAVWITHDRLRLVP